MSVIDIQRMSEQLNTLPLEELKPIEDVLHRKRLAKLKSLTAEVRRVWSDFSPRDLEQLIDVAVDETRAQMNAGRNNVS